MPSAPPTWILMHRKENRATCTVWPLRTRPDLTIRSWPGTAFPPPANYLRIGLGGPLLSAADAEHGLLLLDATWRHVTRMEADCAAYPLRSLPPAATAFPRVSRLFTDPDGGLATVEALFLAYRLTGRDTSGLLDHYRWAAEFLAKNRLD